MLQWACTCSHPTGPMPMPTTEPAPTARPRLGPAATTVGLMPAATAGPVTTTRSTGTGGMGAAAAARGSGPRPKAVGGGRQNRPGPKAVGRGGRHGPGPGPGPGVGGETGGGTAKGAGARMGGVDLAPKCVQSCSRGVGGGVMGLGPWQGGMRENSPGPKSKLLVGTGSGLKEAGLD